MFKEHRGISRIVVVLAIVAASSSVSLADFTGSFSGSDLVGSWGTGEKTLSWSVVELSDNWFRYTYTLTLPRPSTSHFIIEVSDNFTAENYRNLTYGGFSADLLEKEFLSTTSQFQGPGNPGMPTDADWNVGFKVNAPEEFDSRTLVLQFESDRVPVWGDFYAKGGNDSYVYNSGLGSADPIAPAASGSLNGHLLVPDSVVVPLPGAVVLGSLGLGFAGWLRRKQNA